MCFALARSCCVHIRVFCVRVPTTGKIMNISTVHRLCGNRRVYMSMTHTWTSWALTTYSLWPRRKSVFNENKCSFDNRPATNSHNTQLRLHFPHFRHIRYSDQFVRFSWSNSLVSLRQLTRAEHAVNLQKWSHTWKLIPWCVVRIIINWKDLFAGIQNTGCVKRQEININDVPCLIEYASAEVIDGASVDFPKTRSTTTINHIFSSSVSLLRISFAKVSDGTETVNTMEYNCWTIVVWRPEV